MTHLPLAPDGQPPFSDPPTPRITHYDILKVADTATWGEIEAGYAVQARRAGRLTFPAVQKTYWVYRLHSAYLILSDPAKRRAYDAALKESAGPRYEMGFTSDVLERSFELNFVVNPVERWFAISRMPWKGMHFLPRSFILRKGGIAFLLRLGLAAFGALLGAAITILIVGLVTGDLWTGPWGGGGRYDWGSGRLFMRYVAYVSIPLSFFFFLLGRNLLESHWNSWRGR